MSGPRWARSVTPTTMRCARASSPPSRPSYSSVRACEIRPRLGWPFSTSSRPGTIRTGDTRHSVKCRPSTTKGGMPPQLESLAHNCPLRGANSRDQPGPTTPIRQIHRTDGSRGLYCGSNDRWHRLGAVHRQRDLSRHAQRVDLNGLRHWSGGWIATGSHHRLYGNRGAVEPRCTPRPRAMVNTCITRCRT